MPIFRILRESINSDQRTLLDEIWNHFLTQHEWPVAWEFHSPNRKAIIRKTLRSLSSIAAGLAVSLSETGHGDVLLVNMSGEQGALWRFPQGKPDCDLNEACDDHKRQKARVKENLYVVSEQYGSRNELRFPMVLPKLKASEYDYIIFDTPPVNQTSVTARLAGLMDIVLLVVEAESVNQKTVEQAAVSLWEAKAKMYVVLNKS